jgi:secreted PhoX family phosphatase
LIKPAYSLMHRRTLLLRILGFSGAAFSVSLPKAKARSAPGHTFAPLRLPLPLPVDGLKAREQQEVYARVVIHDRLTVPPGFTTDVLAVWGDPLADGRFGYNNDFLAFFPRNRSFIVNALGLSRFSGQVAKPPA